MTSNANTVLGIDLGTTNSLACVWADGHTELVPIDGDTLLPSVVSVEPDGSLQVGRAALNAATLYPERTIRSVKRRIGEDVRLPLGDRDYSPTEISAMILRRLKLAAEQHVQAPIERAIITVPAYFSDAQRTATRDAGLMAGLEVERILNEPTAAALCYDVDGSPSRTLLIYDLGGGTFDVSIVRISGTLTEVLASHGNTALGGDDFDQLLMQHLRDAFEQSSGVALEGNRRALARLRRATEDAKIRLSSESYVRVVEEHLADEAGVPHHLDLEVSREDYEGLIQRLLDRTMDSVQKALRQAKLLARQLDDVILVGGSARTPRVWEMLKELLDISPRLDVNPEHSVALGAGLAAARAAGDESAQVLVDITPYSFGTSHFGELFGLPSPHCYMPILHRSTPLPAHHTKVFYTMSDGQPAVDARIYQGEDPDALSNIEIGRFMVEGLDPDQPDGSPILFDLRLDVNGILDVEVTEKCSGLKKAVRIEDAFAKLSTEQMRDAQEHVADLLSPMDTGVSSAAPDTGSAEGEGSTPEGLTSEQAEVWDSARVALARAERISGGLASVDLEELREITTRLQDAMSAVDLDAVTDVTSELSDVLFYLE